MTGTRATGEGSLGVVGRCVGSLCRATPCTFAEEEGIAHTVRARWWRRDVFDSPYMKPWGRLVLKEFDEEAAGTPGPGKPGGGRRRSAMKRLAGADRGGARTKRRRKAPGAEGEATGNRTPDKTEMLRKKLRLIRTGAHAKGGDRPQEPIMVRLLTVGREQPRGHWGGRIGLKQPGCSRYQGGRERDGGGSQDKDYESEKEKEEEKKDPGCCQLSWWLRPRNGEKT